MSNPKIRPVKVPGAPGYYRCMVDGRRFLLCRRSYRSGNRGSRQTLADWIVTERDPEGGQKIGDVNPENGRTLHLLSQCCRAIATYLGAAA